jgi:hypothetical protein
VTRVNVIPAASEAARPATPPASDRRTAASGERLPDDGDRLEQSYLAGLMADLPEAARDALQRVLQSGADPALLMDGSGRPDAMDALHAALDLTPGSGGSLLATLSQMAPAEAEAALKALAELLKRGVVGYEYREVNGEPMKVFIDVAIGSDLHRAPLVKGARLDRIV